MRLLDRGTDSRRAVIKVLLDEPSQSEDEVMEATGLSRSTVRNALQTLLKVELASSKRRKRTDGKRGPGPIEFWLTTPRTSPEQIESEMRKLAGGLEDGEEGSEVHHLGGTTVTVRAAPRELFVLLKKGTNDAVLTKDGRVLRVEEHALKDVMEQYRRVLKGVPLESASLDEFYQRFYPEFKGRKDRPLF